MTITLLDLYNEVTGQPWSMFDGDVEAQEEFESTVTSSIQLALNELWLSYEFPFREKDLKIRTKPGEDNYNAPVGNIAQYSVDGVDRYGVTCEKQYLNYIQKHKTLEEKEGVPEYFYLRKDRLYLYPIPDNVYTVNVEYYSLYPAVDAVTKQPKTTLVNEQDYINIPERYEQLFKSALLPLSMVYAISSDSDENHSGYQRKYKDALDKLIKFSKGISVTKRIGW